MNQIGNIQFSFLMENEKLARELHTDWDRYFRTTLEPVADALLQKYAPREDILFIDKLHLNLGNIPEAVFKEQFPALFRAQLEEALLTSLPDLVTRTGRPTAAIPEIKHHSGTAPAISLQEPADHAFRLLTWFLLHGSLPWYTDHRYKNISFLFIEVIRTQAKNSNSFSRHTDIIHPYRKD